jgi:membrane protein DedA with SNARE-associated domain
MDVEFLPLVAKYGYAATFAGTLLEGETVLVLSGAAAFRGLLDLPVLCAIGAGSAFLTDNFFFALGRWYGPALLARWPRFAPTVARVHALVDRFPNTAVIGVRFFYGMRSVGPAIIGAGNMSWPRFILLDVVAVVLWSTCWTTAGYVLGAAALALLEAVGDAGRLILVALAAIAIVALLVRRRRRRAAGSSPGDGTPDA